MNTFYIEQTGFTSGEVSPAVGNRTDLEKYPYALAKATNCYISPYGPVSKRQGSVYVTETKYVDKKCVFERFIFSQEQVYLLEIGHKYIRIYFEDTLVQELSTPFEESLLKLLRFNQSQDVLLITSGKYKPLILSRYGHTDWRLEEFAIDRFPLMPINNDVENKITPSGIEGSITLTASKDTFTMDMVGTDIEIIHDVPEVRKDLIASPPSEEIVANKGVTKEIWGIKWQVRIDGYWEGTVVLQSSEDNKEWIDVRSYSNGNGTTINESGESAVPRYFRLKIDAQNNKGFKATLKISGEMSTPSVWCDEWRLKTTGWWKGTITVQRSTDNNEWANVRTYVGNRDVNVDESGINETPCFVRVIADVTNTESFKCTLIGKSMTSHGLARIKSFVNEKEVQADVEVRLGSNEPTANWKKSYWRNGHYPRVACWWQDRLWFAGYANGSNVIWGSRTSDYANFSVERVSGDLTDDSACIFPLVTKDTFSINWLIGGQDLIILADAVEYRVDGSLVVTPKNFQASVQSGRGSNNCKYQFIGNQIVFVQRRGGTVRELGFEESQNSYIGDDLTILAKHLVEEHSLEDACYMQEPHSMIYFVRDDGIICCLSYIKEQKVYAWSTIETNGQFEAIMAIPNGFLDTLYCVVRRTLNGVTKRCIEKLMPVLTSNNIYNYNCLDCMIEKQNVNAAHITGLNILANEEVQVVFTHDDDLVHYITTRVSTNGEITLPYVAKHVKVGLPYTCLIGTLNVEVKMPGIGTIQGKEKQLVACNLRLMNSQGGKIGQSLTVTSDIPYPDERLKTGDIKCDIGGERNLDGRLYIIHEEPTPFTLLSLVREVSL